MYFVVAAVPHNKILSALLKNWGVNSNFSMLYFYCNFLNFYDNDLKFWHKINIIFFRANSKGSLTFAISCKNEAIFKLLLTAIHQYFQSTL